MPTEAELDEVVKLQAERAVGMLNFDDKTLQTIVPMGSMERALGEIYIKARADGSISHDEHFAIIASMTKGFVDNHPDFDDKTRTQIKAEAVSMFEPSIKKIHGENSAFYKLSPEDQANYALYVSVVNAPSGYLYTEVLKADAEAYEKQLKMQAETKTEAPAAKEEAGTPQAFYDPKTGQNFNTGATGTEQKTMAYTQVPDDTPVSDAQPAF